MLKTCPTCHTLPRLHHGSRGYRYSCPNQNALGEKGGCVAVTALPSPLALSVVAHPGLVRIESSELGLRPRHRYRLLRHRLAGRGLDHLRFSIPRFLDVVRHGRMVP